MAQLPPFRTRRSEPAFFPQTEIDDEPLPTTALDPDDDVPVLTHVVQPPPPAPALPQAAPIPETSAVAPTPPGLSADELDALARQVVDALQPDLLRLVRDALEQVLEAAPHR